MCQGVKEGCPGVSVVWAFGTGIARACCAMIEDT